MPEQNELFTLNHSCPVKVGDRFYRNTPAVRMGTAIPDLIEVKEITEKFGTYFIRGKYIYHAIGPTLERVFSDVIFKDPDWIIVKKGETVNGQ